MKKVALLMTLFALLALFCGCKEPAEPAKEPNPASDFEYEISSEIDCVYIIRYIGTAQDVVIPSQIEGLPVRSLKGVVDEQYTYMIGEGVFEATNVKTVVIPETVEIVGMSAFQDCVELTSVTFLANSNLKNVMDFAFKHCEKLDKIDFSNTKLQKIRSQAFYGCKALKEITFSDTLEHIGERAFYHCSLLSVLDFPASLTKLDDGAFGYCSSVSRIVIPAKLDLFFASESAFHGIISSVELEFEPGREVVTGYALIQTAADVKLIIPKSVKQFAPLPFLITPTAKVDIVFAGDAPEIIEEKEPDWFGSPVIHYDPTKQGWDAFEWKDRFEMIPHNGN
jgi:hypothetical protein